jgi:hypothetical protein
MRIAGLSQRLAAIAKRIEPREPRERKKMTTAENRQEIDRLVAIVESREAESPEPVDETVAAEIEARLLAQPGPLDAEAAEFLRIRQLMRDVNAARRAAEGEPMAIDVKAELAREGT